MKTLSPHVLKAIPTTRAGCRELYYPEDWLKNNCEEKNRQTRIKQNIKTPGENKEKIPRMTSKNSKHRKKSSRKP